MLLICYPCIVPKHFAFVIVKILRFFEIPFYAEVLCARVFAQGASGA